ncbi:MAG TPA: hypothetical protein VKR58_12295, partial [Aquella sp.]|nr:hypothetical protein [Aquella sp.]
ELNSLKSYTHENAQTANIFTGQFPVVLFSPGSGDSAQDYENIITNIVFFDAYVKSASNPVFNANGCFPLTQNTIISCGPTIFPN